MREFDQHILHFLSHDHIAISSIGKHGEAFIVTHRYAVSVIGFQYVVIPRQPGERKTEAVVAVVWGGSGDLGQAGHGLVKGGASSRTKGKLSPQDTERLVLEAFQPMPALFV